MILIEKVSVDCYKITADLFDMEALANLVEKGDSGDCPNPDCVHCPKIRFIINALKGCMQTIRKEHPDELRKTLE